MSSVHYSTENRPPSTPMNAEQVYLEGECIVVPEGYVFPRICLVTGKEVETSPREYGFPRTKYVSEADMTPGSLGALLAGTQRSHWGPKSKVSFCLQDGLLRRRRNLAVGAIVSGILAFILPLWLTAETENGYWLLLFFGLMGAVAFCIWCRDRIISSPKATPSFVWLAGVNPEVRQAIYEMGCRK